MNTITFLLLAFIGIQRPVLINAQAIIESGSDIKAVGTSGERGAFQVREKFWGKVPKGYIKQAHQAEGILNTLIKRNDGDLRTAMERYNGMGIASEEYASRVFTKTFELLLIGV